jgi:hypothetical protein
MLLADFSSLCPNGTVRVTEDSLLFAVDFTMLFTGKNRDEAGFLLRNLDKEVFSQVLVQFYL